eukprot:NODE_591_length_2070_cov_12.510638_g545_i0.p1 GENE.NODE_591_length_2070_cov_12.510638_g545_i0~~NODE_591_length_2070_cov_12.510638_g545_i0.p1  ORF type:complete len:581 (+),score=96.49 NODE_591_length_2070_cov_12.510638_g545_i0:120-1862(+)
MWVEIHEFRSFFERIKSDSHENLIGVTILAGADCDALCSLHIFGYKSVPIRDYSIVQDLFTRESEREVSWVLLNCGASVDITQWANAENHKVYIIDSHRPAHLSNVQSESVFLFDDGSSMREAFNIFGVGKLPRESQGAATEPSSSSGDGGSQALSGNTEEEADSLSDSEDAPSGDSRKRKRVRRSTERDYYRRFKYTQSSSVLLYQLADQLGRAQHNDAILWMAIVGLTDHYVFRKIARDTYREQLFSFQHRVNARLLTKPQSRQPNDGLSGRQFDESRIIASNELCLFLLHFWSLVESMRHTQYVVGKLQLCGTEKGDLNLTTLMSKVGASPDLRMATFHAIDPERQEELKERLQRFGRLYGMKDLAFRSFVKHQGFGFKVSAADMVHISSSLLNAPYETECEFRDRFWAAYNALESKDAADIKDGLLWAKEQQTVIVRQATLLFAKNALVNTGPFRYVFLPETTDTHDLTVLVKAGSLRKMGKFLLELMATKNTRMVPVVLAAFDVKSQYWTLVGIHPEKVDGTVEINTFGYAFQDAAVRSRSTAQLGDIEPGNVRIHKDSLTSFIAALHQGLLQDG